jgi:hypothetical protein
MRFQVLSCYRHLLRQVKHLPRFVSHCKDTVSDLACKRTIGWRTTNATLQRPQKMKLKALQNYRNQTRESVRHGPIYYGLAIDIHSVHRS